MPETLEALQDDDALPAAADVRGAAAAWFAHMAHEQGRADATLEAYARDLTQFLGWLARELGRAPTLADLGGLDARRFRAFMAAGGGPAARAARWHAACRACAPSSAGWRGRTWPERAMLLVVLPKVRTASRGR